MAKFFFLVFTVLFFIPLRSIPLLPIAPINIFVCAFLVYIFFRMKWLVQLFSKHLFWLLFIYLCYIGIDTLAVYLKHDGTAKPFQFLRHIIFSVVIIVFAYKEQRLIIATKTVSFLIFLSTFFSLLIYFFGEPFQSIRLWILNNPNVFVQTKGARLTGLTTSIFAFSYQISAATVLAYGIFMSEKRMKWLCFFMVLLLGVVLNGERSSALMVVLSITGMTYYHYKQKIIPLMLIFIACFTVIGGVKYFMTSSKTEHAHQQNLIERLGEKREGEFKGRILQGISGIITAIKNPILGGTEAQYQKEVKKQFMKYTGSFIGPSKNIPASHNHYVNIALHAGILGIFLFLLFCFRLLKIVKQFKINCKESPRLKGYYIATTYAIIAVLGNALFHNHGIFFAETASWALVGLLGAGSILLNDSQEEMV